MANTQVTGDLIADGAITAAKLSNVTTDTISEGTSLYYTDARVASYLSANSYATEGYVTTAVNNLIDAAPASLDTLNELAAALNDDANFATTVTNSLATKLNLSGGNITGNLSVDTNVLFVDTVNDKVGIGTSSPTHNLHISNTGGSAYQRLTADFGDAYIGMETADDSFRIVTAQATNIQLYTINTERMRITSAGNVGIGTSSPSVKMHLIQSLGNEVFAIGENASNIRFAIGQESGYTGNFINSRNIDFKIKTYSGGGTGGNIMFETANDGTSNVIERMRIGLGGDVNIGAPSGDGRLNVKVSSNSAVRAAHFTNGNFGSSFAAGSFITIGRVDINRSIDIGLYGNGSSEFNGKITVNEPGGALIFGTSSTDRVIINSSGGVTIYGSLSKGSGSFKIDHPLKPETHHLVHSFVESPQANNIYRGKVQLVDGKATVNLDQVSTMTEGTFVALNRDIHTYTSNESDWDAVIGKVEGNILTIECQNTESTATVSWLVIGERQDKHMYDTEWTDENGKVIVEPEKAQLK